MPRKCLKEVTIFCQDKRNIKGGGEEKHAECCTRNERKEVALLKVGVWDI